MEYDGTSSLDRPINWQDVEPEPFPFDLESLLAANAEMERNLASGPDREFIHAHSGHRSTAKQYSPISG